jgi:uncharacterized protein
MPSLQQARLWYPNDDPVHGFDHVLRVYRMAERLALAEGADLEVVQAAVLLHDAQTGDPGLRTSDQVEAYSNHTVLRLNHHQAAAEFAGEVLQAEGWPAGRIAAVQHCIRAHRFRDNAEEPQTLEAQVLFDADKLDAIGAIGAARAVAYAARHGQPACASPSESFLRSGQTGPGEQHSAYHEYRFKLIQLKERLYTPTARLIAEERHRYMVDYFERLAAESLGEM